MGERVRDLVMVLFVAACVSAVGWIVLDCVGRFR